MDPTERFSNRVETYNRYRPGYPPGLLAALPVHATSVVADVGSGTGLLSQLFLNFGCTVYGIEPNQPMRQAGEENLKIYKHFHSLDGRAEDTGLASQSVDLVVAGQAFHWFEPVAAGREFQRILRHSEGPRVALVWNEHNESSDFEAAYRDLTLEFEPDYMKMRKHASSQEVVLAFLGPDMRRLDFPNAQWLDREGLHGRLLSSSFCPLPDHPRFAEMQARIDQIFDSYQTEGQVRLTYSCQVYLGSVQAGISARPPA